MATSACPDVLLMLQTKAGDQEGFNLLVLRYRNELVGYLARMVLNHAVAEELAQETFLRAYRSRHTYEPSARFKTWLYAIGMRLALNWIRDTRRKRRCEPLEGIFIDGRPREFPDPTPLADAVVMRSDKARAVQKALANLPERQRMVVIMHKYQDLTYEEIAEVLGCSQQAVKSLLFRAHSALRELLVASGAAEELGKAVRSVA
jgi:RNA polymerase sigma-70 factor (ECF subfamily)